MTRDEAKFILGAYRPGGGDAGSAVFAEALRDADHDPALRTWFERSRSLDAAVVGKLREILPPAGLREAILAGARASGSGRRRRRRFVWIAGAAAATVAVLLSFATWRPSPAAGGTEAPETEAIARFALDDMANGRHGGSGEESGALQSRLSTVGAPMPGAGEIDFAKLRATGCRTLHFAGREVLEVCFSRAGVEFHFYVFNRGASEPGVPSAGPSLLARAGGTAAVWSDKRFDYAVVTGAGIEAVRRLF
jgi:hypothetical protein